MGEERTDEMRRDEARAEDRQEQGGKGKQRAGTNTLHCQTGYMNGEEVWNISMPRTKHGEMILSENELGDKLMRSRNAW